MTPQRHVRDWLIKHNTTAIELSAMVGKSPTYAPTYLSPSGGNPAATLVLDKIVHFSPQIMRDAYSKQTLMNKKKRREIDKKAGRLLSKRMMAWKAPKETA